MNVARNRERLPGSHFHSAIEQTKSAIAIQGRELDTGEETIITDLSAAERISVRGSSAKL